MTRSENLFTNFIAYICIQYDYFVVKSKIKTQILALLDDMSTTSDIYLQKSKIILKT